MCTLQNIHIYRIRTTDTGIYATATFPGWHQDYEFWLGNDGSVKGKSFTNSWQDLSSDTAGFIKSKIFAVLSGEKAEVG